MVKSTNDRRRIEERRKEKRKRIARRRKIAQSVFLMGIALNLCLTIILMSKILSYAGSDKTDSKEEVIAGSNSELIAEVAARLGGKMNEEELNWVATNENRFPEGKVQQSMDNPGLIHFLYLYGNNDYSVGKDITFSKQEKNAVVPLLIQWDERWGFEDYGSSVIGITGCGPTCVSMIVLGLTGNTEATPKAIADFATKNEYYLPGTGTKWSLMLAGAAEYGVDGRQIGTSGDAILEALSGGNPLILNVGPGHFTSAGHFIVVAGTERGKLIVHDPNSVGNSSHTWEYDEIKNEIRDAWVFYR